MKEQPTPYKPTEAEEKEAKGLAIEMETKIHKEISELSMDIDKQVDELISKIRSLGFMGQNARGYNEGLAKQSRDYALRDCHGFKKSLREIMQVQ